MSAGLCGDGKLLGPFDRLLADSNLFPEVRLRAVQNGQGIEVRVVFHGGSVPRLGPENKRGCLRSVPMELTRSRLTSARRRPRGGAAEPVGGAERARFAEMKLAARSNDTG